jgi:hypothetical protein
MAAAAPKKTSYEKFIDFYERNIKELLAKPSNVYAPNEEKIKQWVEAQVSQRRRQAAAALASQLRFFSFDYVRAFCQNVVKEIYKEAIPDEKKFAWFGVEPGKSGYFIATLCYHYAKEGGYRLPTEIYGFNLLSLNLDYSKYVLFCFDDMSYSGSQMSTRLNLNFKDYLNKNILDVRVGLISVSEHAQELLSRISPEFKFYFANVIPSLLKTLGFQQYLDCITYFSLFQPDNFVYFEHKLADDISTFLKVFQYGPVPPSTFSFIQENLEKDDDSWFFVKESLSKTLPPLNKNDKPAERIIPYLTQHIETID